jgi:phosphoenolpyruvate phosphomutase
MYYKTPTQVFAEKNIALVIWANHSLRASITNMQKVVKQIYEDESLINIEPKVVPVKEVFRLQNTSEYKQAEERYLPQKKSYKGLILAASKGSNFGSLTDDKPKTMIKIGDETILQKLITTFNNRRIKDISVVVGYKHETVNLPNLKYIVNDKYDEHGILYSLYSAIDVLDSDTVISFGDILFEEDVLRKLIITQEDILLAVDAKKKINIDSEKDLVESVQKYSKKFGAVNVHPVIRIQEVKKDEDTKPFHGEFMGLMKLSDKGAEIFRNELTALNKENPDFILNGSMTDFLNYLIEKEHPVMLEYFKGHWKDIDSIEDLTYLVNYFAKESDE